MAFLKKSGDKHALAVAMTGIKLGDRLLLVGCTDATLAGAISSKVGLSGLACAIMPSEADAARVRRGAQDKGVLLEVAASNNLDSFPFDNGAFNLIVLDNQRGLLSNMRPEQRVACLRQAFRTLGPRGRIILIERQPRSGLGALFSRPEAVDPHYQASGGAVASLEGEGFRAVRHLAARDGMSFFEGVR